MFYQDVEPLLGTDEPELKGDHIQTDYHPNSLRATHIEPFDQYQARNTSTPPILNRRPWLPFHSEAEFSFAEIALQTAMSNKQLDALINVVHTLMKGDEPFKLKSHRDVQELWDKASSSLTPVGTLVCTMCDV